MLCLRVPRQCRRVVRHFCPAAPPLVIARHFCAALPPLVSARHFCAVASPLVADDLFTPQRRAEFISRVSGLHLPLPGASEEPGAAVLVPLCRVHGTPGLLYTLRSSALKKHAGEVSFPGGLRDPQDEDLLATAIRETREEVGLKVERDQVWTRMTAMVSRPNQRSVAAYVADVGEIDVKQLRPEPHEVADVFVLTLDHLCQPENRRQTQFRRKDGKGYAMPVFVNGAHRVWGYTAIMTYVLLLNLVPEVFTHKLRMIKPVPLDV